MGVVTSKDGTEIAYTATGEGPVVLLVAGAFGYRAFGPNVGLVPLLADRFTAVLYDRRGRGDSGDAQPFEKRREIEDLAALIEGLGGWAYLYGTSSGAALAAEAASVLGPDRVTKLAMHEPSYILDDSHAPLPENYMDRLRELLAEGRRGDMVALFMTDAVGMPVAMVEGMKQLPFWPAMEGVAHTLIYDGAFMVENQRAKPMTDELRATLEAIKAPTLVIDGGATFPFLHNTADVVASVIPGAQRRTIDGQQHDVAPEAIAPVLAEFLSA
jgi:pimeloyl-ACP methyl ester carboxylesterase